LGANFGKVKSTATRPSEAGFFVDLNDPQIASMAIRIYNSKPLIMLGRSNPLFSQSFSTTVILTIKADCANERRTRNKCYSLAPLYVAWDW